MSHPLIVSADDVYEYIETLLQECGVFKKEEIDFVQGCATRLDGQPGMEQVSPLLNVCEQFIKIKRDGYLTVWEKFKHQGAMRKSLRIHNDNCVSTAKNINCCCNAPKASQI